MQLFNHNSAATFHHPHRPLLAPPAGLDDLLRPVLSHDDVNQMPSGGMLSAIYEFHGHDIARGLLAITFLLVVFNCLSSFQIYSMPVFDSFEASYTSRTNRPCSVWVRSGFRVFYGFISLLIGVAFPFLSSLAGLLGGLTLPVTFAYPCFMWVLLKQPPKYSFNWYFNWILGWLGIAFSVAFSIGILYTCHRQEPLRHLGDGDIQEILKKCYDSCSCCHGFEKGTT